MARDSVQYCSRITNLLQGRRSFYINPAPLAHIKYAGGRSKMTQLQALDGKRLDNGQTNWVTAFFMAAFHIGAVAALFFFTWQAVLIAIFLWWISGSLGIGMGYHRLLTHRG
jgi:hypothetical protein